MSFRLRDPEFEEAGPVEGHLWLVPRGDLEFFIAIIAPATDEDASGAEMAAILDSLVIEL